MFFPIIIKSPDSLPTKFLHSRVSGITAVRWKFKSEVKSDTMVAQNAGKIQIVNKESADILNYTSQNFGWMNISEGQTEYPRLYQTSKKLFIALLRGQDEFSFGFNGEYFFTAACWIHNEYYHQPLNKYVELNNFFPGCPRQ